MRRFSSVPLLGILVFSLFASTCLVSIASANEDKEEKWFYWDVYLYFPEVGPPMPFNMESNLIWANLDYIVEEEDLYVDVKFTEDGMFFFHRAVRSTEEFSIDGVDYTGEYTLEMVIIWELPYEPIPGTKSTNGKIKIYDGTGVFEGIDAHGSASVEYAWDETYGLILIQYQDFIINQYQNDIVVQKV